MKKKALLCSIIAALVSGTLLVAGCQHRHHHSSEQQAEKITEHLTDALELNETQQEQLEVSVTRLFTHREDAMALRAAMKDEMREQLRQDAVDQAYLQSVITANLEKAHSLLTGMVEEMAAFHQTLTPGQRASLVKVLEKHKDRHNHHHF